jgi:2-desacetyl-2-hydroxyethyl bacteriochlorophyllide A dehydrogenase
VIEALGSDVGSHQVGDVVFAFQPHQERFVAPVSALTPVAGLEPRIAVLLPYVETALQVALDAGPVFGETVAVSGLGVLGLLVAMLLGRAGGRVIAIEPQAWRRTLATELGIDAVAPRDAASRASGVPLVIECSGNPAALDTALALLGHEGTALVASWYGTKPVALALGGSFHRRRLTIRSTQVSTIPAALSKRWTHRRRLTEAVALARDLPLAHLASHTIPFERAGEAYARIDAAEPGVIHMAFGYC